MRHFTSDTSATQVKPSFVLQRDRPDAVVTHSSSGSFVVAIPLKTILVHTYNKSPISGILFHANSIGTTYGFSGSRSIHAQSALTASVLVFWAYRKVQFLGASGCSPAPNAQGYQVSSSAAAPISMSRWLT